MLLRDVIAIPESIRTGDLVFKLTDATEQTDATLDAYVVTDQLRSSFLEAVDLVGAAVTEGSSKAAYLSGSFGAGKSNFMGVLQLLLDGHPAALAKPELAPVVAAIGTWRGDRRFLTVPFHLIGATSMESAVFGGYVDHVQRLHPEAPLPDVFADEPILANADSLRQRMGDEAFFASLGDADDGWGDLGGWTAERYDAARTTPGDERRLLVQALLADDGLLSAYAAGASARRGGYVDMDTGLAAISRHAHELGYAGLILFLDELILWLLSRLADSAFVGEEASKIAKLVEGAEASRPVPIISFIARQRDLRELVGTDVPGAEKLAFVDQLDYMAGRFTDIVLDDSNLPVVAHQRLLRPVDDDGARALAEAFDQLHLSPDVRDALRGATGTDADFRLTYPFSPAFLTVVVDVAGALQRTRTGLRVLLELLVDQRDHLEVGQLVPVGDLYDVLAAADDPLSEDMKQAFAAAKRLYATTLRPLLLAEHGLAPDDETTTAFTNDDRLIKTLLLAALVPNSAPFQDLTARKLVALNHGLITSPVPGAEVSVVVNKLNAWAARAGELQVGTDPHNPTVRLVLSEVDTRAILASLSSVDSTGNRRKLLRDLVADELGIATDQLVKSTTVHWKGLPRTVDLEFGNIRNTDELTDNHFAPSGTNWKVVIDFPFDEDGHDPRTDLARIATLQDKGHNWRTVCWVPSFFTAELLGQLGDLVRLDHLLPVPGQVSERFREATANLSAEAREQARPQLEAQQRAARDRVRKALLQAYGVTKADPATVDTSHGLAEHFESLLSGFRVRPPVAASLRDAFTDVVVQALDHAYPAAPDLEGEVRAADLRRVFEVCEQALEAGGRLDQVPTGERKTMRAIANPLRIGVQSEQAFTLDVTSWDNLFTRKLAERQRTGAEGHATVRELRAWIDDPQPRGLSTPLQNLVLLVWAAATDRTFLDHGGPARASVDSLADHYEVVAEELPDDATWAEARARMERVFGVARLPDQPSAVGLARLGGAVQAEVDQHAQPAADVVAELERLAALLPSGDPARLATARVAAGLLADLQATAGPLEALRTLVAADLSPSPEAIGASIKASGAVAGAIRALDLDILAAAFAKPDGPPLREDLSALFAADELGTRFAPALDELYRRAKELVVVVPDGEGPSGGAPVPPVSSPGRRVVLSERRLDRAAAMAALDQLRERIKAEELEGRHFDIDVTAFDDDGGAG